MLYRYLWVILLLNYSPLVLGQGIAQCDLPTKECLTWLETELPNASAQSKYWYKLKLLQFDALTTTKNFVELQQQLDKFNNQTNLPQVFATQLKIYQAKLWLINGQREQAKALINLSLQDLQQLNQAFYSPNRLVRIANLMLDLEQYQQVKVLLEQVAVDYQNSKDSYLKLELYGNLGHTYRFLGQHQQALDYYKMSLDCAMQLAVAQQISVLHTHVARMYHLVGQLDLAQQHFNHALQYAEQDNQNSTILNAKIDLAYFYATQEQIKAAQAVAKSIDSGSVLPYQQKKWQLIKQVISLNP
ncbi:tetratricopeptide repeat protein [Paraglaciecola aestuariivivens]